MRDAGPDRAQPPTGKQGTFTFLTYNVAGLPKAISSRHPEVDVQQISSKLNPYDVVAVQEDFAYHDDLIAQLTLPHRTPPKGSGSLLDMGDGLNAFSKFPLTKVDRDKWKECNGLLSEKNDCFAPKGLLKFTIELAPGIELDVYNIHTDAGRKAGDASARDKQMVQLNAKIAATSKGKAILVVGDTNMNQSDEATLQALLSGSALTDACRKLSCPEPARYDRIMFRSSAALNFTVKDWHIETNFRDAAGNELSDHEPVKVTFDWAAP
jgi:Endonuclease/Exonuclease/phosphatase family